METQPMVYVGPSFRNSPLKTYTVYADGVPSEYAADPIYKHLFVPPEKLDKAIADIGRKGSALSAFYRKAIEEHAKGGK